jgi:hypothetical protein
MLASPPKYIFHARCRIKIATSDPPIIPIHTTSITPHNEKGKLALTASGVDATSELLTSRGRIDLAVHFADKVYVLECRCDQSATVAVAQIEARGYAGRYRRRGKRQLRRARRQAEVEHGGSIRIE